MVKNSVEKIISQMIEILLADQTLSTEQRDDAINEVEIVSLQLDEAERNEPLLAWALNSLAGIPSIYPQVKELRSRLIRTLRHHA